MSQPAVQPAPPFAPGPAYPPPRRSGMSCLLGCAIFGVVCVLICGGVTWWVVANAKRLAIDFAANVGKQMVDSSELRPGDKTEVKAQIDRVADGFKQGKLTADETQKLVEGLTKSPLFSVLMIYGIEQQYLTRPERTAEEKEEAERILQRIARGCVEKKITTSDLAGPLKHISQDNPGNQPQPKQQLTDEDLKACLDDLEKLADEKDIPDEPYELNVGAEVKRIVDEAAPGKL